MCVNGSCDSQFVHLIKWTVNNFGVQSSAICNSSLKGILCMWLFRLVRSNFLRRKNTRNAFHKTCAARNSCSKGNIDRSKSAEKKAKIYVYVWKNTRNAFLKLDDWGSHTKLNRYSVDALYARHGSRSCKNITRARERWHLENAVAVCMKRPLAEHGTKHRKIREEHQNYLPSNTHLEGKPSSKYYLRFTG